MIEVGQLRRWTYGHPPIPAEWRGETFLMVEEEVVWVEKSGRRHCRWKFLVNGTLETHWREEDVERMSEVVSVCEGG